MTVGEVLGKCTKETKATRAHVATSTRYRDQENEAPEGRLLYHHPYLILLLIQGFLKDATLTRKGTRKVVRTWSPNSSDAALGKLIRVSPDEQNGMWLRCLWHSIKLALETGGFLIQPVLDEGKPERLSNMQIVEKDSSRSSTRMRTTWRR